MINTSNLKHPMHFARGQQKSRSRQQLSNQVAELQKFIIIVDSTTVDHHHHIYKQQCTSVSFDPPLEKSILRCSVVQYLHGEPAHRGFVAWPWWSMFWIPEHKCTCCFFLVMAALNLCYLKVHAHAQIHNFIFCFRFKPRIIIRPKKKNCYIGVTRPTLKLGPTLHFFFKPKKKKDKKMTDRS